MNDFDETFELAFYNSFLKIKIKLKQRKYVHCKVMQFSKDVNMCSDLLTDICS